MNVIDSPTKILLIVLIAAVLFGYKRLPEMSRSVGRSLRIFKSEMKGLNDDDAARADATKTTPPASPSVAPEAVSKPDITPPANTDA
jgi:sec-independent protein translocase protein TatA